MVLTVRKKPVVVEAMQWTGSNWENFEKWCPYGLTCKRDIGTKYYCIVVDTLEGKMRCEIGDFIVKGVEDEYYPVKKSIFAKTYEIVTEGR